jgi:4,5-dihydroxyphthalate decarboxylase
MRSYSQTTPTWVRGILSDDYGVKLGDVTWLSQEGAHVAEYRDPPWVRQLDGARNLEEMLRAGEVDAIIAGSGLSGDPGLRPLLPEPRKAAMDWYRRNRIVPINHMVAVRRELAEERPDVVREIYRALVAAREASGAGPNADGIDLQPHGYDAVAPAIEMVTRFAHEQSLVPERYPARALFGNVLEALR